MRRLVLTRLAWMLPILLGVSVVAFVLMRALPGDFAQASAGTTELAPEALNIIRRDLGLDQPVWEQYLRWLAQLLITFRHQISLVVLQLLLHSFQMNTLTLSRFVMALVPIRWAYFQQFLLMAMFQSRDGRFGLVRYPNHR